MATFAVNKNIHIMKVHQLYTNCLAHGAYYIESEGEAAIIDPLREVEQYIELARERGAHVKYIFETHFHADFVSGHVDLARKTGAPIVYGPTTMQTGFEVTIAKDGQEFPLGKAIIRLLHTPGHTMESSCFLLLDEQGREEAIFTGDTLFIGDVGRPDLAQHVISDLTEEKLATHLFHSLRDKIMTLPDHIMVYPGHGAGSACGKNLSKETSDTLGHQKEVNYALRSDMSLEEFKKELLTGLMPPPAYFPKNVVMNIQGYKSIDDVIQQGTQALSAEEFDAMSGRTDVRVIDTRDAQTFAKGHVPGSWNIGLGGSFASWVGTLVKDVTQQLVVITEPGKEEEAVTRLARVGFDHVLGCLKGGFTTWIQSGKPVNKVTSISAAELAILLASQPDAVVVDVRKKSEYDAEHVVDAINAPLDYIDDTLGLIPAGKPVYVHCAAGYRSMAFVSIAASKGYKHLIDVAGGFQAIREHGALEVTDYVCPTTML
jgi:hydroxyacylglutathione hydrolase